MTHRTILSVRNSLGWTASTRAMAYIRQFVAMPLGSGYTVEGQITGAEEFGGIQILAFEPKPGRFPDAPPPRDATEPTAMYSPVPVPRRMRWAWPPAER